MPHVLVAGKLHPAGLALLDEARGRGFTHDYVEEVSEPSYAPLIAKADALLIRTQPLSAATVARADRLRIVSRHGVGYDAVDLPALNARGITLTIVGDVNSSSVAEHTMMLLLSAAKRIVRSDRAVRDPAEWNWRNRLESAEIFGKNLLLLGYGRIGRLVGRLAGAFGMEVRAHDPRLQAAGWPPGIVPPEPDLMAGLGWADVVSVHVPNAGAPILGDRELRAMKRGAILINTARGGLVAEQALAEALSSGQIGAAGLDVFADEPPDGASPLARFDQVVLTPHTAGLTTECAERMAVRSVQNILDFFSGALDPALIVNRNTANV